MKLKGKNLLKQVQGTTRCVTIIMKMKKPIKKGTRDYKMHNYNHENAVCMDGFEFCWMVLDCF